MQRLLRSLVLAVSISASCQNVSALSPEQVFAKASPSVVMVFVVAEGSRKTVSQGSGVSVGGDKVITNCHVVFGKNGTRREKTEQIVVRRGDRKIAARLLAANKEYDTCLLSVSGLSIPTASIAETNDLRVGQRVYAIGAPSGLELTLTEGLLSAFRLMGNSRVIQTSAAIAPGSSGGGLFDERGNLIGITSFGLKSSPGLNFAYMPDAIFGLLQISLGSSEEEAAMSDSVQATLPKRFSDHASPKSSSRDSPAAIDWLAEMSRRTEKRLPDRQSRLEFLRSVHYEATRAGLDPQLVLALIDVVSDFNMFAVSPTGARGFMSVRPEWTNLVGRDGDNLFALRTNLRYGCTILRHYLDIERGDLFLALAKYELAIKNGPGSELEGDPNPRFPNAIRTSWDKRWSYTRR